MRERGARRLHIEKGKEECMGDLIDFTERRRNMRDKQSRKKRQNDPLPRVEDRGGQLVLVVAKTILRRNFGIFVEMLREGRTDVIEVTHQRKPALHIVNPPPQPPPEPPAPAQRLEVGELSIKNWGKR